jgi:replication factor C subunit 1
MLQQTKPITLSGSFRTPNIKSLLQSKGYKIIPSLSKFAQLIIDTPENNHVLTQEARKRGLPVFLETDILPLISSTPPETRLLVDKLAPTHLSHVIGHREQIKELLEWLRLWPQTGAAVLISGPPGIGKTTCAHLIVKECGYFCKEYNASDNRTAATINNIFATDTYRMRREVIIMDEADGFDRGGIAALAAIIRTGRVPPIICIANERTSTKLKPLLSVTTDIRFSRPVKTTIAKAIKERATTSLTEQELVELCERNGNDIRAIINALQMESTTLNTKDSILRQDIFSATQRLFNERRHLSIAESEQLVFVDYAMVPLMVQECAVATAKADLDAACRASDLVSQADLISTRIHATQAWQLLPDMAAATVTITRSTAGPAPFNMFPQWLGKNSKKLKHARQIQNMAIRSKHTATALREDYWTPINVIASQHSQNAADFASFLGENKFTRDDYFETLMETMFEPTLIPTKDKTAITRFYNKKHKTCAANKKLTKNELNSRDEEENSIADAEVLTDDEDELKYYV